MSDYVAYVGLDVHQDTMAVAVITPARPECVGVVWHHRQPPFGHAAADDAAYAEG